jgi:hypothetical protein
MVLKAHVLEKGDKGDSSSDLLEGPGVPAIGGWQESQH